MAENVNLEIAKHLHEHAVHEAHAAHSAGAAHRREEILEIVEAVLLAVIAVMTAWSGYQAAMWDGESAKHYAESTRLRTQSIELALEDGQITVYDADTLVAWLQAEASGHKDIAQLFVNRFTPEYRVAFEAWLKFDPIHNAAAPAGPRLLPEFRRPLLEQSKGLGEQANEAYREGIEARHKGEQHVRLTVLLATVLFLIAVGQRFRIRNVRVALLVVAGVFLAGGLVMLARLPQA